MVRPSKTQKWRSETCETEGGEVYPGRGVTVEPHREDRRRIRRLDHPTRGRVRQRGARRALMPVRRAGDLRRYRGVVRRHVLRRDPSATGCEEDLDGIRHREQRLTHLKASRPCAVISSCRAARVQMQDYSSTESQDKPHTNRGVN